MNKAIKKFAILAGIFLAAAGIYFFTSLNNMEQSETVYTVMDASGAAGHRGRAI